MPVIDADLTTIKRLSTVRNSWVVRPPASRITRTAATTLTGAAVVVDDGEPVFAVFNIGDSRVYRFEANELVQLTVDHSVVQELVDAGSLSREDAERHPEANVITRAIGFHDDPDPDVWICALASL